MADDLRLVSAGAGGADAKPVQQQSHQKHQQQPLQPQPQGEAMFGPADFHEMKELFKASSSEFESLKDGINSLRNVQLLLRQNEQQMGGYESRLENLRADLGGELDHLREKVLKV